VPSTPDNPESFMTVAEIAEILKLNQQTVRNWIMWTPWLCRLEVRTSQKYTGRWPQRSA
jgi:hypothetical protein